MILDSGDEIYVWVGNEASDDEKKKGLGVAKVCKVIEIVLILKKVLLRFSDL